MPELVERVRKFMVKSEMPKEGSRVLIALSGGGDSVGLMLLMRELGMELVAAHCNFGLRAAAQEEEEFCRELCEKWSIPLQVRRFSTVDFGLVAGESTQLSARRLRYAFFEELMAAEGIAFCATAHHADDQTETLIMSMLRGKGPRTFHAIPPRRGRFFRPLLCLSKEEIQEWLRERGQSWCEDASNQTSDYQRNRIRNELVPILSQINPKFGERLLRQAEREVGIVSLLDAVFGPLRSQVVLEKGEVQEISMERFEKLMQVSHFETFLEWWLMGEGFSGTEIHEIQRLVHSQVGAMLQCADVKVLRDRGKLIFRKSASVSAPDLVNLPPMTQFPVEIQLFDSVIAFSMVPVPNEFLRNQAVEIHWLDADQIQGPMCIRRWKIGDRLQPWGASGTKKVSDVLIDQHRDSFSKDRTWVIEDANGIVLLAGFRIDRRVALTPETKRCMEVRIRRSV